MIVIVIAGSRNLQRPHDLVRGAFYNSPWSNRRNVKIISGGGGNIDKAAEVFAKEHTFHVP